MTGKHTILAASFAALIALTATSAHAGDLVVNGSFADTSSTWVNNSGLGSDDWQTGGATAIPGWSNVAGFANEMWIGPSNSYGLTASLGNSSGYLVDLTGQANNTPYGGIEQTITTVAGDSYVLTFDLGASTNYNPNPAALTASALGDAGLASQLFTLTATGTNDWATETLDFTADSTSTTIEFLGDTTYTSEYIGLDNVSVTDISAVATPEPATWLMILSGFIALAVCLRSRGTQLAVRA